MEREVRYCTTEDGVRIAYCLEGEGYPLLWCPIFAESFSHTDDSQIYRSLMADLAQRWTLVRYDPRGIGLSERDVRDVSNSALALDIEAVVTAAALPRLALWANAMTGPRAITYAARHTNVVSHLILYNTFADPWIFPHETAKALADMARTNWRLAADTVASMGARAADPDSRTRLMEWTNDIAGLYERSSNGEVVARMFLEALESWDVREMLPNVNCQTLIVHAIDNRIFPFEAARQLAADIPGAQLAAIKGAIATPLGELAVSSDPVPRIERFLPIEQAAASEAQGPFRTVLFTDLVGHSEMMSRLGDQLGREVLREHESITRKTLKEHAGAEVKTMGDGFMASFASVTKAVECAIDLQKAFTERNESAEEPLNVRVGLNAGEPIEDKGDLFGATVILAARIAAKAEAGEILVADTVRGLCHGKGFVFQDRGEFVAKGFEEPVRVYNVRWNN